MKVKQINPEIRGPYFVVEFGNRIAFTDMGEYYEGIFTLGELNTLGQHIDAALQDYDPPKYHVDKVSDDPSNVDTDPPDEYHADAYGNTSCSYVYEDEDGHDCKVTVDGG